MNYESYTQIKNSIGFKLWIYTIYSKNLGIDMNNPKPKISVDALQNFINDWEKFFTTNKARFNVDQIEWERENFIDTVEKFLKEHRTYFQENANSEIILKNQNLQSELTKVQLQLEKKTKELDAANALLKSKTETHSPPKIELLSICHTDCIKLAFRIETNLIIEGIQIKEETTFDYTCQESNEKMKTKRINGETILDEEYLLHKYLRKQKPAGFRICTKCGRKHTEKGKVCKYCP